MPYFFQAYGNSVPLLTGHKKQDPCHICSTTFYSDMRHGHQLQGVFDSSQREENKDSVVIDEGLDGSEAETTERAYGFLGQSHEAGVPLALKGSC